MRKLEIENGGDDIIISSEKVENGQDDHPQGTLTPSWVVEFSTYHPEEPPVLLVVHVRLVAFSATPKVWARTTQGSSNETTNRINLCISDQLELPWLLRHPC